jgi:hypothetical protein
VRVLLRCATAQSPPRSLAGPDAPGLLTWGFAVDEDRDHLGDTLVLPPWLEAQRETIQAALPRVVVRVPSPAGAPE